MTYGLSYLEQLRRLRDERNALRTKLDASRARVAALEGGGHPRASGCGCHCILCVYGQHPGEPHCRG